MSTVIFHFNGNKISVQCKANDTFEKISQNFAGKTNKKAENLLFIYNGSYIEKKLTFEQLANNIDKSRNIIDVLTYEKELKNQDDFEKERNTIKDKMNFILSKYLEDRTFLKDKVNNWRDAILNECNNFFLKYPNYITFVSLVINNKSLNKAKYYSSFDVIKGKTTQVVEVNFKSDKMEAQMIISMFLKERSRTPKDLTEAFKLTEKEFLNLAEGRTFEKFYEKFYKMFEDTLINEILPNYKYSLFYFYQLSNEFNQSSNGFLMVNKNKDDYYLSKTINAGNAILYLLFGKAQ